MRPDWIASTVFILAGFAMLILGHFDAVYASLIIFGAIVLAFGITVSAYSGGVKNPIVLIAIFFALTIAFVAVDAYNIDNLRGWL